MVRIRYWQQDTLESGRWCLTGPMSEEMANRVIDESLYESASIIPWSAEEEKRQKNVAHQKRINNEAVESFMALMVEETTARALVMAIAKGQIANVFIKY